MTLSILVAEDDPMFGDVLIEALELEGHTVRVVQPGVLLAAGLTSHWDICLVDSPGSSSTAPDSAMFAGYKALAAGGSVIAMTAHQWAQTTTPEQLGVAAILRKPFDLEVLFATIDQLMMRAALRLDGPG
jgi:DNA-binding NtrC family response regulator